MKRLKLTQTEKDQILLEVNKLKIGDFIIIFDFEYNKETNTFLGLKKRQVCNITAKQFSFINSDGTESCRMGKTRFIDGSNLAKLI